jgi:hypothetical protein
MHNRIEDAIRTALSDLYWAGVSAGHPMSSGAKSDHERRELTTTALEEIETAMCEAGLEEVKE